MSDASITDDDMSGADALNLRELQAITETTPDSPLRLRTKLAFALVTMLSGLVIGSSGQTESLPIIVVFFSVIGFLFVDWMKLFALPAVVAYAAMAIAAIYCVSGFMQGIQVGNKMETVAELLIIAQSILMLQEKTSRLFEQLMVFALLNCVVAAVFNDAFAYAIFFVPLTICSGMAIALLAADNLVEQAQSPDQQASLLARGLEADAETDAFNITWNNSAAVDSFARAGVSLPWMVGVILFPAVLLFAAMFFFGLPRRVDANRGSSQGVAMVGFSDTLHLSDISQMQQNSQRALRVDLIDRETKKPYPVVSDLYLRGAVLEQYLADEATSWRATSVSKSPPPPLPPEFVPKRISDSNFYDRVNVRIACESMSTESLFAIAPYHWSPGSDDLMELSGKWTVARRNASGGSVATGALGLPWYPPVKYHFGTHAFRSGVQSRWLAYKTPVLDRSLENSPSPADLTANDLNYLDQLLEYPQVLIPTAESLANKIVEDMPPNKRTPAGIADAFQKHLSLSSDFRYSLQPNPSAMVGVDPIEQFLSTDRRGHCQFFASALVMMLRSQNIPARVVVGYHTDEFSELGQYFIVRQSHAHVWVEALIARADIPMGTSVYGQPESDFYWLRLDPTPGGGGVAGAEASSNQMLDLARDLWDDYVIEMDSKRQEAALMSTPGLAPMTASYRSWIDRTKELAMRINSGDVEGIGGGKLFSWQGAVAAIVLTILAMVGLKIRFPRWLQSKLGKHRQIKAPRPSIPFYAEALDLLSSLGIERRPGQTPEELTRQLEATDVSPGLDPTRSPQSEAHSDSGQQSSQLHAPMRRLTDAFYALRYGQMPAGDPEASGQVSRVDPKVSAVNSRSAAPAPQPESSLLSRPDVEDALSTLRQIAKRSTP
ncbi:Transglutaminase-like enzyme, putative cysteine protease [Rhodopirellula islandica]|uniref:Transglutaminase-like enzyme, putative cysteine protease n=1 Tax=Rhodopirellula islandica TaxID=595434 RepID=A0A0J1B7C3_RHOIS|nr:transglutaminaseTgpA domain-containing protein [Rhodopirellula islandica]KLU02637.1 Transglutaminase-like enzyme, putative cysteine protease [Rhodopirellula islandica]